jgi:prepilin-type N-terminal cleavage/methylation domain-containing protein
MRRGLRPAGRAGFTLIELLVVVAILALLAALVAAGIAKVKEAQQARVSDQTLTKLQLAVEKQWKAVCDQCRDDRRNKADNFQKLVPFCDGDADRAEALWMYMNLRRNMPHTFQEARTPVVLKDSGGGVVVSLPASATFNSQVPNIPLTDQYGESAALLYLILTQGARGSGFALDDAMQGAQTTVTIAGAGTFTAFKDGFGTPIIYRRFYQSPELNQAPYVRAGLTITDPLDPTGKLYLWRLPNGNPSPNLQKAVEAVFALPGATPPVLVPSTVQPSWTATSFDGKNKIATVISAGPDARNVLDSEKPFAFQNATTPSGEETTEQDNAYGYRILRQGNRGD